MTTTILHTENLAVGYHHKPVLENFSLAIKQGDFVGLKGLNGSGKTTLLKTLSGLLTPINGKVFIQEKTYTAQIFRPAQPW